MIKYENCAVAFVRATPFSDKDIFIMFGDFYGKYVEYVDYDST